MFANRKKSLTVAWRRYHRSVEAGASIQIQTLRLPPPDDVAERAWWVDLKDIELQTRWRDPRSVESRGIAWCVTGEWDRRRVRMRPSVFTAVDIEDPDTLPLEQLHRHHKRRHDDIVHETMRQWHLEGIPRQDTLQYRYMVRMLNAYPGRRVWASYSLGDIDKKFDKYARAFDSMQRFGYLTQAELGEHPTKHEIKVYVTRDGRLCQVSGGTHRIRMAEILGIESVSVSIVGAHARFVAGMSRKLGLPPHAAVAQWVSSSGLFSNDRA